MVSVYSGVCLQVLQGVTLGMARAEIDYLICLPRTDRTAAEAQAQVRDGGAMTTLDAVALCEVKRDSSDLGYAVSKSAETLAWLAREHERSARRHRSAGPSRGGLGRRAVARSCCPLAAFDAQAGRREEYDAAQWRNRFHPTGHFGLAADGTTAVAVRHAQYAFDQRSFECFRRPLQSVRGGAALPPRLHIVTSNRRTGGGDALRPLPSGVFGQLQRKAARDLPLVAALLDAKAANWLKGVGQLHTEPQGGVGGGAPPLAPGSQHTPS